MKGLLIGLVLLVLFVHFGGSNVPKVLKDNKQMVYGVTIGLVLCSFFGVNIEGLISGDDWWDCMRQKCNDSNIPYCDCVNNNQDKDSIKNCMNNKATTSPRGYGWARLSVECSESE